MRIHKSSKSKAYIFLIAGVIFICFLVGCFIGWHFLNNRVEQGENEAICIDVEKYMKQDNTFESEYGEVVSVALEYTFDRKKVDSTVCRIPCVVKVASGREYLVWVTFDMRTSSVVDYYSIDGRVS